MLQAKVHILRHTSCQVKTYGHTQLDTTFKKKYLFWLEKNVDISNCLADLALIDSQS